MTVWLAQCRKGHDARTKLPGLQAGCDAWQVLWKQLFLLWVSGRSHQYGADTTKASGSV